MIEHTTEDYYSKRKNSRRFQKKSSIKHVKHVRARGLIHSGKVRGGLYVLQAASRQSRRTRCTVQMLMPMWYGISWVLRVNER